MSKKFNLGSWVIDFNLNILISGHETTKIEPQMMAVLSYLIENSDRPVDRHELIEQVWQGKVVSDHAVYKTINQLRKALAQEGEQEYIKTIPKKGYMLTQNATLIPEPDKTKIEKSAPQQAHVHEVEADGVKKHQSKWVTVTLWSVSIVILMAMVWWLFLDSWYDRAQVKPYIKIQDINFVQGVKERPLVSPDGNFLLVGVEKSTFDTKKNLYMTNMQTGVSTNITNDEFDYSFFSWSSSGNSIIASRRDYAGYHAKVCEIVILYLSKNKQEITEVIPVDKCDGRLSNVSYDDISNIAYYTYAETVTSSMQIIKMFTKTGKKVALTKETSGSFGDREVTLSPDRKKLAFFRDLKDSDVLMYYDLEQDKEYTLYETSGRIRDISWSDDNRGIVYREIVSGPSVYYYSLEHGYSKVIATSVETIYRPSHLPNAKGIVATSHFDTVDIISVANPRLGDASKKEVVSSSARDLFPAYANLSNRLAYVSDRSGKKQIWLQDEKGVDHQLSFFDTSVKVQKIKWSPNDKELLFSNDSDIYILDIATMQSKKVFTDTRKRGLLPSWSYDGQFIYFSGEEDTDFQIYRIEKNGQGLTQITENGGYDSIASLDGEYLYYIKYYQKGLWRKSLRHDEPEQMVIDNLDNNSELSLDITDKGIYYVVVEGSAPNIYYYAFDTKQSELVLENVDLFPLTVSYDEKSILLMSYKVYNSSIKLLTPAD